VDQAAEGEILRERGHAPTLPYDGRLIGRVVAAVRGFVGEGVGFSW
jgi:hypothetical protein